MGSAWRRNEVFVFLCGIVVVNAIFVTAWANEFLPKGIYNYGRFVLLGGVMVCVVWLSRGFSAVLDLVRPLLVWRVAFRWYVLAMLWAVSVGVLFLTAKALTGLGNFSDAVPSFQVVGRPSVLLTVAIGALIGEIVWIGYSVRQLSERYSLFVSALIVGAFWTAWWMPMAYFGQGIIPGLTPVPLLINQTGVALMCALFYFHTRSALVVLILQIGTNGSLLMVPVLPTSADAPTYLAFSVTYFLVAIAAYLVIGPRPLFDRVPKQNTF